jgi:hypothetical protein
VSLIGISAKRIVSALTADMQAGATIGIATPDGTAYKSAWCRNFRSLAGLRGASPACRRNAFREGAGMGKGVMAAYNSANAAEFFCNSGHPLGCRISKGTYSKVRLTRNAFANRAANTAKHLTVRDCFPRALPDSFLHPLQFSFQIRPFCLRPCDD